MPNESIKTLAVRLQSAAYRHGTIDAQEYGSDKKYRDAMDKSDAALKALLDAINQPQA